jgi:hypothetical protein
MVGYIVNVVVASQICHTFCFINKAFSNGRVNYKSSPLLLCVETQLLLQVMNNFIRPEAALIKCVGGLS